MVFDRNNPVRSKSFRSKTQSPSNLVDRSQKYTGRTATSPADADDGYGAFLFFFCYNFPSSVVFVFLFFAAEHRNRRRTRVIDPFARDRLKTSSERCVDSSRPGIVNRGPVLIRRGVVSSLFACSVDGWSSLSFFVFVFYFPRYFFFFFFMPAQQFLVFTWLRLGLGTSFPKKP